MSKLLLDQIIVIDLESTCWDDKCGNFNRPDGQQSEIIEIGVATVDVAARTVLDSDSIIVCPKRSKVSDFCTKLTGHTQKDIDQGISFDEACSILKKKYFTHKRVWASWGDYDRVQFERDCYDKNIRFPFGRRHINIKTLFALQYKLNKELPVGAALEKLGLQFEGRPHKGVDDAKNIARLLISMLGEK